MYFWLWCLFAFLHLRLNKKAKQDLSSKKQILVNFYTFFQSTHSMFDTQNLSIHTKWVVQTLCANGNQSEHCLDWVLPNQNILLLAQMLDQSVENVKMVWSLTHEILSVFPNLEDQNTMSINTSAINMSATDTSVMSAIMLDSTSQHQLLLLTRKLISNVRFEFQF